MLLTDQEKKVTAYHEAGHALVSNMSKTPTGAQGDDYPRGMALVVTVHLPDDRTTIRAGTWRPAGHALWRARAEEIFLNQMSTGAGNDIERARNWRDRWCANSDSRLGPLPSAEGAGDLPRARDRATPRLQRRDGASDRPRSAAADRRAYQEAHSIVEANGPAMHRIAAALLERRRSTPRS